MFDVAGVFTEGTVGQEQHRMIGCEQFYLILWYAMAITRKIDDPT